MTAYLYTKPDCAACEEAKMLLARQGRAYVQVPLDNPLVELGVQSLFMDGLVHAPVLVEPGEAVYVLSPSLPRQWRVLHRLGAVEQAANGRAA